MQITLTPEARSFLSEAGTSEVAVTSLVFSSCCSGPLPPEVKPGRPGDTDGFLVLQSADVTVYYDTLLDEKESIQIDVKDYGLYRELVIKGWQ